MLRRTKIVDLLKSDTTKPQVLAKGWVRTRRDAKDFSFIELNDGSCLKNLQIIAHNNLPNYNEVKSFYRFVRCRNRRFGRVSGRQPKIRSRGR